MNHVAPCQTIDGEGTKRQCGVPDRGTAGLDPRRSIRLVLDEPFELPPALADLGGIVGAPEGAEGDDAPEDRREDRPEPVAPIEALEHPAAAFGDGTAAERTKSDRIATFQDPIDSAEEPGPPVIAAEAPRVIELCDGRIVKEVRA